MIPGQENSKQIVSVSTADLQDEESEESFVVKLL